MEPAKDAIVPNEFSFADTPIYWTREATQALLSAYEMNKDRLGQEFRFQRFMWVIVSAKVKEQTGKNYTPHQCENRWRVLIRSYRKAMGNDSNSVRKRKDFEYQEVMHRILNEQKNNKTVSPSDAGVCASGGKSAVRIDDICSEPESVPNNSKQSFNSSGNSTVNIDAVSGDPELAASSNQQFFIISGTTDNSGRIGSELEPAPSNNKQLFLIRAKPIVKSDRNGGEPVQAPSSSKQLFIVGGKSNVNSDSINSEHERTPSSNEPETAATSCKRLFVSPSKPSISHPEKRRKMKQSFLEQIRADRKLYHEKKLEVDKDRLEGLERRNDELLQLKKQKLQQTERLIACEEERLKCDKEKLLVSREKLKLYGRLVQLQEDSNDILRSINDQLDFLL